MRHEIREAQAQSRRLQIAIILAGAVIAGLVVLIFDAILSP